MNISATKSLINNTFKEYDSSSLQEEYTKKRVIEPLITKDLALLSNKLGTSWCGLEYSVKTASSIEDKIKRVQKSDPDRTPEEIIVNLKDIIRYTQICEHEKIFDVAKDTINILQENGYSLLGLTNYYEKPFPSTGYKGLHLNILSPYGQEFELQIHSEESFKAKDIGHELYEKIRSVSTPIEEKERLKPEIFKIHSQIPNPPGYKDLHTQTFAKPLKRNLDVEISSIEDKSLKTKNIFYIVKDDSQNVLVSGFENYHSDGSILTGKQFAGEDKVTTVSFTNKGEYITEDKADIDLSSINEPVNISVIMERTAYLWEQKQKGVLLTKEENELLDKSSNISNISFALNHDGTVAKEANNVKLNRLVSELCTNNNICKEDILKHIGNLASTSKENRTAKINKYEER